MVGGIDEQFLDISLSLSCPRSRAPAPARAAPRQRQGQGQDGPNYRTPARMEIGEIP